MNRQSFKDSGAKFLRLHGAAVGAVVAYVIVFFYPAVVALNNPLPKQSELQTISAEIVSVQQHSPNLTLRLSNGETMYANFPGNLFVLSPLSSPRFSDLDVREMAKLRGCTASLEIKRLDWHYPRLWSVWDLQSICGRYDYARAEQHFRDVGSFGAFQAIFQAFGISLVALVVWAERHGNRNRRQSAI